MSNYMDNLKREKELREKKNALKYEAHVLMTEGKEAEAQQKLKEIRIIERGEMMV